MAVGAKRDAGDIAGMPLEGQGFLPGRGIPNLHRLVEAGGCEPLAVGAKRDAGDIDGVPLEGEGFLAGSNIQVFTIWSDLAQARRRPSELTAVALHLLGQSEVGDPRIAIAIEQDIGRLQITVNHVVLVGILDGLTDTADQIGGLSAGSGPSARRWERLCPSTKPIEK